MQRVVGTELHSSQGDTIKYYKSDIVAGGGTSNPNLLSRRKYLEMLRTTVEDSLKVMGYDYMKEIVGYRKLDDSSRLTHLRRQILTFRFSSSHYTCVVNG